MARSRPAVFLAILCGLSVLIGCAKDSGPLVVPISGEVRLDGKPLTDGFLYFRTVESGALERFDIEEGEFKGNAQLGTRRVEVIANRPRMMVIDEKEVEVSENIIHPSFNLESKLTAEVSSDGPNRFRFEVTRK